MLEHLRIQRRGKGGLGVLHSLFNAKKLAQHGIHATACSPPVAKAEVSSAANTFDAIAVTSKTPPKTLRPLPNALGATYEPQYVGRSVGRTSPLGFKLELPADWRGVHLVFSSQQLKPAPPPLRPEPTGPSRLYICSTRRW